MFLVCESAVHVYADGHRRAGIEAALADAGASIAGTVSAEWWPEPGYAAVRAFLSTGARPSALICLNDRLALGAYQAAAEAGLRIPEDLSVVSFDDSDLASWLRPQLTSLALPHFELGRRAVELLDVGGPAGSGSAHLVPMPLRLRASLGPPAGAGSSSY